MYMSCFGKIGFVKDKIMVPTFFLKLKIKNYRKSLICINFICM